MNECWNIAANMHTCYTSAITDSQWGLYKHALHMVHVNVLIFVLLGFFPSFLLLCIIGPAHTCTLLFTHLMKDSTWEYFDSSLNNADPIMMAT